MPTPEVSLDASYPVSRGHEARRSDVVLKRLASA
jgi:hypothetical protein